ncbi:MAG TPA: hypothetical protein PKA66_05135 [Gemmatimonadales bacterium]|nr:hypothetical protein [Gemmatimonadales bacterium]
MEEALYECARNLACAEAILTVVFEVGAYVDIMFGNPRAIQADAKEAATKLAWDATGHVLGALTIVDYYLTEKRHNLGVVITHELGHVIDADRIGANTYKLVWDYDTQEAYTVKWNVYYRSCQAHETANRCSY